MDSKNEYNMDGAGTCDKAPMALEGKHVYSAERLCIYCGAIETKSHKTLQEIPGNEKVKTQPAPMCPGKPPLDSIDILGIMGAFEMNGRILAIQARIEGMKIRNTLNEISGHSPQYGEIDFQQVADNITMCVDTLRAMKHASAVR